MILALPPAHVCAALQGIKIGKILVHRDFAGGSGELSLGGGSAAFEPTLSSHSPPCDQVRVRRVRLVPAT
jgi:hypothetical protein